MVRQVFLILCLFIPLKIFAQNSSKAELSSTVEKLLTEAHEAFMKDNALATTKALKAFKLSQAYGYNAGIAGSLVELSYIHEYNADYDSALICAKKALKHLEGAELKRFSDVYRRVGSAYLQVGEYDSTIWYTKKALLIDESFNGADAGSDLIEIATAYSYLSAEDSALYYYLQAIRKKAVQQDKELLATVYVNMTTLLNTLERHEEALKYQRKALNIDKQLEAVEYLIIDYHNLAATHKYLHNLDSSVYYSLEALKLSKEAGLRQLTFETLTNLAIFYEELKQVSKSKATFMEALQLAPNIENPRKAAVLYLKFAEFLTMHANAAEAVTYLNQAAEYFEQDRPVSGVEEFYAQAARTYEAAGRYTLAYNYLRKQKEFEDSVFTKEKAATIAELETAYRTEQVEKELAEKALALSEKEKVVSRRNYLIIFMLLGVAILMISGIYTYQRYRSKQKLKLQNALLEEKSKGLRAIVMAEENERRRIARELHDSIGAQLIGIKLALGNIHHNGSSNDGKVNAELNKAIDEVRGMSHRMMPKSLEEMGLIPAINDLLDRTLLNSNIKYNLEHNLEAQRLAKEIEVTVYRITQELINNIIKHSGATSVQLSLFKTSKAVTYIVEDNGKGMAVAGRSGLGLYNIKSRLETIHGKLNIETEEGTGTTATIIIPMHEN